MHKSKHLYILIFLFTCASCAGRTPNPVMISKPEDNIKSCEDFNQELNEIDREIHAKYPKIKQEENTNLAVGLAGAFIPFTAIFKDYKRANLVEENALRLRFNHLVKSEREKKCGFEHSFKPVLKHCEDFYTLGCFWQP